MDPANVLALPSAAWESEYLEDTSLRRLVLEYYDREHVALRRYLSFLGIDQENGRDLVQDTFLKLHQHLLAKGDRTNLRAWLFRVAHNLARNSQTSLRATKTDPLPDSSAFGDLPSNHYSAEDRLLSVERTRLLHSAVGQLTSAQKSCLVLRAQGLKYREIADVLDLAVSTVGENVHRGLQKLKEVL